MFQSILLLMVIALKQKDLLPRMEGESKLSVGLNGSYTYSEIFLDRIESQKELHDLLDICFSKQDEINFKEFKAINEQLTSEMVLCILSIFREKLPHASNFYSYRRNYEEQ